MAIDGPDGEGYTVPFLINGKDVHPERSFEVTSPATGKVVHRSGSASEVEVQAAVDAATEAFKTWRKTTPQQRRNILFKAADVMDKRKEELAKYMMEETGCPQQWADFNVMTAKDFLYDVGGRISSLEGSYPATNNAETGAIVLREPFGVVLAIAPW